MLSRHLKKSIAASAVLASSVAAAAGSAGAAHAAPAGPATSPLTLDRGAWAPDGSRYVYAGADGAILTQAAAGGGPVVVDPAKPGVARSHPTWFDNGAAIVFSETAGGTTKLMSVPAYTDPQVAVKESSPVTYTTIESLGAETAPDASRRSLAMQHHNSATGHDEIWVQDGFGRGTDGPHLASDDGVTPSLSPDGKTVVFVRADAGGNKQLWAVPWAAYSSTPAGAPVQLTTDAHDHLNPTWSPDGTRIAYEQGPGGGAAPTSVQSVAKDGSGQRQEADHAGVPSYQPLVKNTVTRLAGDDRIGTALAASQAKWPTAPGTPESGKYPANAVVLARYDLPYDALGGSALAATNAAPLLLTAGDQLDARVKAEITRVLGPVHSGFGVQTVYVLGGEKALSPAVYNAVKALGYQVKRVAGADRYETSVAIAKEVNGPYGGTPTRFLVATGDDFPDALSAGAAANIFEGSGRQIGVVLLSHGKVLPPSVSTYLSESVSGEPNPEVYAVGGQADAALAGLKHKPLVGSDRYQTSYLVARTFFSNWHDDGSAPTTVGLATGTTWPDALSGGTFMAEQHGPLLLVDPVTGKPSAQAQSWLKGWAPAIDTAYVFGGTAALGPNAATNAADEIAGPAGVVSQTNPKA